jgi:hypothetical protein
MSGRRPWGRCPGRLLALAILAGGAAILAQPPPTGAQAEPPCGPDDLGFERCEWIPPGNPDPQDNPTPTPPDDDDGDDGPADPCPWQRHPRQAEIHRLYPDAPEGAILLYRFCDVGPRAGGPTLVDGQFLMETTWVLPGEPGSDSPAGSLSPELVAQWLWARVLIEPPEVVAYPDPEVAAIVGIPTFVEVTNWVGEQTVDDCFAGLCVSVTATPTLSFDPGELDPATGWAAAELVCEAPGTRFDADSGRAGTAYDPGGAEPSAQAAVAGACAYAYRLRTGVGERPTEWPGSVVVTWEGSWTSDVAGVELSGDFEPIVVSTDVPRAVDEVQAPVVDADLGGSG